MASRQETYDPAPEGAVDLRSYLAVLRQSWLLIFLTTVFFVGLAAAYTFTATPQYTASARINLKPTGVNLDDVTGVDIQNLIQPDTEQLIATSRVVATAAKNALNTTTSEQDLLKHVAVTVTPESAIMEVDYTDPNPRQARDGAIAFSEAYLEYRGKTAEDSIASDRQRFQVMVDKLHCNRFPSQSAGAQSCIASQTTLLGMISTINSRNVDAGDIISEPAIPIEPSSPNKKLNLALGLIIGLFGGIGIAFFRSRTDDRLRGAADLQDSIRTPVLSVVPKDTGWTNASRPRLVTLDDPRNPVSEAYRTLRPSVLVAAAERGVKTIMVVSPSPGEGKSTTSANLGVVLAQADKRVVVISADLRRPRLHEFFGLDNDAGLSQVLDGSRRLFDSLQRTAVANLSVLPSGPVPQNPAELLQSQAMRDLLREQGGVVDFIIVDCPPVLSVGDALGIAPFVDGVLFVADAGATTVEDAEKARIALDQVGANVIGAVLNDFELKKSDEYYHYGTGEAYNGGKANGKAQMQSSGKAGQRKNKIS
jgi:capsular exopolysaccharide synthesis family protein